MDAAKHATLEDALLRTGGGDHAAFRVVYRLTAPMLLAVCLRVCGERGIAEDVLQDVFVTAWLSAERFDPERGSAAGWLARIARNRALDWRRSYRPARESADVLAVLADPSLLAVDQLLLNERDRRLHVCLDGLEKPQRDAIRTAFFDDVTYAELAARAAVPVGTMKSRLRRGLMRLRENMDVAPT